MSTEADAQTARARTIALTVAALLGFAANSLLCRMALRPHAIDPASFTLVRLSSGALVLALLVRTSRRVRSAASSGSWPGAFALFAYAIAFSFAYTRLDAGTGALILFGVVQATMLTVAWRAGERLGLAQGCGLALALAGLVLLVFPGLSAPDPLAAGLMALAGVAWGVYSLLGRRSRHPLADTAGNFARSVPLTLLASLVALPWRHAEPRGIALALASGALASGVGYSLWYAALRGLSATRASIAQLAVPAIAAGASAIVLGEALTLRASLAGAAILGGVALALARSLRSRA